MSLHIHRYKVTNFDISSIDLTFTNSDFATTTITHDSNEDVPKAQHTTGDVEDFDVFLVVVEEDDTEIFYDNNNLMMISITSP